MGTGFSMVAEGKSDNSLARKFRVRNPTKQRQTGLVLSFKNSQFFEHAAVSFELEPSSELVILLPHTIRPGSELQNEEIVTYALTQKNIEQCTITATVWLREHSLFSVESERGAPVDFTKPFMRTFIIRNSSSAALPATATLVISRTACFQPAFVVVGEILPGATKTVTLEHRLEDENTGLETIEEFTSYALKYNGIILKEFTRRARMYEYSLYLSRYQPSEGAFIRILLCGAFGSGKSSFICSVCTALDPGDLVLNMASISPFGGHGTTTLRTFRCGAALPFVLLVDTWGKTQINYTQQELLAMLDGGASMDNPELKDAEGKRDRMHSMLMFVQASNVVFDCERNMLNVALSRKYNATILMSKCETQLDEAKGETREFRKNPNAPIHVLEAKKAAIGAAVGTGAVLQVSPYLCNETSKSFERDRLTLRILECALNSGRAFQSYDPLEMGANVSIKMSVEGKSDKNDLARKIRVANMTYQKQADLMLYIKTSQFFEHAVVDFELEPHAQKVILLPHVVRPGSELQDKENVTYALTQRNREQCTTTATVRLREHSSFNIESERGIPVDFTRPFTRTFKIYNSSSVALPSTATLTISGTACFQPAFVVVGKILPKETKTVTLEHRLEGEKTNLETIEECTSYALKCNGTILKEFTWRASMYEYSGYLARYRPSGGASIRIILFGIFGSGKTSFVTSVRTALSPGDLVLTNVAPNSPFGGHGTATDEACVHCGDALPFVSLVDTQGKMDTDFTSEELQKILDEEEKYNEMCSVLLFVPASRETAGKWESIVSMKHYDPVLLVSQCDLQLTPDERKQFVSNPNVPIEALEAKKASILAALGTGVALPVAPYLFNETSKVFERDRLTLRILERALEARRSSRTYHPSQGKEEATNHPQLQGAQLANRCRELEDQVTRLTLMLEESERKRRAQEASSRRDPVKIEFPKLSRYGVDLQQDSSTIMLGDVVSLAADESLRPFSEFLALDALKELYDMEQAPADWHAVRGRIVLGPVLDWDPISTHLANEYFKRNPDKRYVGFLNCGRGRVRYQLYEKDPNNGTNKITLLEDRPGNNEEGAEIDKLRCGSYQPEVMVDAEILKHQLEEETKHAPWARLAEPIAVYGFVAGQIRDEAEFRLLRLALAELFPQSVQPVTALLGPSPFGLRSYSMSSQDEGKCLIEGARAVYQQMKQLDKTQLVPVASLKIGPDAAQWAPRGAEPLSFLGGSISPSAVGLGIAKFYRRNPEQLQALCEMARSSEYSVPTIALQPGLTSQFILKCQAIISNNMPVDAQVTFHVNDDQSPPSYFSEAPSSPGLSRTASAQMDKLALLTIAEEELVMEEVIGMGAFSTLRKATWKRKAVVGNPGIQLTKVAVKMSNRVSLPLELARDVAVISSLPHQNILILHGVCESPKGEILKIVYELMTMDLSKMLKSEKQSQSSSSQQLLATHVLLRVLRDVSAGLAHLHQHGVIHRDVKPSNVLLRGDQVKLCDFGSSMDLQHSLGQMSMVAGTLDYMAPEVINRQPVGRASDAWSFGVLLFECVTGHVCARTASTAELCDELKQQGCLPALVPLFAECHENEPGKRPSMDSLHARLQRLIMQDASDSQRLREELKRAEAQDRDTYHYVWNCYYADQPHSQELLRYVKDLALQFFRAVARQPLKQNKLEDLESLASDPVCARLHGSLKTIVEECGGTYMRGPRKSYERCVQKIEHEYEGNYNMLLDLEKATGLFERTEDMLRCLQQLRSVDTPSTSQAVALVRCKDRLNNPLEMGYRDVLMNVRDEQSGFLMELQLNFHKIAQLKSQTHRFYELSRVMELRW